MAPSTRKKYGIDFMKLFSDFAVFIVFLHVRTTIMCAILFIMMNCSSSFSAEKTEYGEIAAQQVLARIVVCLRKHMPMSESNDRVACCCTCARPQSAEQRAFFESLFQTWRHAFQRLLAGLEEGVSLKYLNLAKQLHPIITFVRTLRKRFHAAPPSC